jgi:predicted ABC-type transport system involved in lysophospholipase L1 biosynthesis ATPase subunit
MALPTSILKLSGVTIESSTEFEFGLNNVSCELKPGELWLVRIEREDERLPLADAAEGLAIPTRGSVTFLGEDWRSMSTDHAAARRGKIGRLFEDEGWISGLDLDENIMLAQRHHTRRSEEAILDEAVKFARLFGLRGLPPRPAHQRAAPGFAQGRVHSCLPWPTGPDYSRTARARRLCGPHCPARQCRAVRAPTRRRYPLDGQ